MDGEGARRFWRVFARMRECFIDVFVKGSNANDVLGHRRSSSPSLCWTMSTSGAEFAAAPSADAPRAGPRHAAPRHTLDAETAEWDRCAVSLPRRPHLCNANITRSSRTHSAGVATSTSCTRCSPSHATSSPTHLTPRAQSQHQLLSPKTYVSPPLFGFACISRFCRPLWIASPHMTSLEI